MRRWCVLLMLIGLPSAVTAQGPANWWPVFGERSETVELADIPADIKPLFSPDARIGFHYDYFCLFSDHLQLWTWNGQYVFVDPKLMMMASMPHEDFVRIMGDETMARLHFPWTYYVTPAQIVLLSLVSLIVLVKLARRRRQRFLAGLADDPVYQEGLRAYAAQVPADRDPTVAERKEYLREAAAAMTAAAGVNPATARKYLRHLVSQHECAHAEALRAEADELADAEKWGEAAALYLSASQILEMWNPQSTKLLQIRHQDCLRALGA